MTCDSKKCNQMCNFNGCIATCGPDVEECTQECHHTNCVSYCNAKMCVKKGGQWIQGLNSATTINPNTDLTNSDKIGVTSVTGTPNTNPFACPTNITMKGIKSKSDCLGKR